MDGEPNADAAVSLRGLLSDAEFVGADDVRVTGCTDDAQACRRGDVFVARSGSRHASSDDVATAVRRGARAIVASQPVSNCPLPVCYVPDAGYAFARICQALAGEPSRRLKVSAVAGAFGKTTTGYLVASVLSAAGKSPGVIGSLGYCDGHEVADARWTTPPAELLAQWLRRMADHECTHAVLEVSACGLLESRTAGVALDSLCLTNLRRMESETRDCTTDQRRLVGRALDQLAAEGVLVVNADDPNCTALLDRHDGPAITFGLDEAAEISATIVERHRHEQTFLLSFGRDVIPVRTSLLGDHNVANCLAAAAVGAVYGIAPEVVVRGLESVRELPGRLERLECGQPFGVFLDEARSPETLATALRTLRPTTTGRLICMLSTAPEHDRPTRVRFGRTMERWCDYGVLTASPHGDLADEGADDVSAGFRDVGRLAVVADRAEAVRRALDDAGPGDCVLIAGQTVENQPVADERTAWDDRHAARRRLHDLAHRELDTRRAA